MHKSCVVLSVAALVSFHSYPHAARAETEEHGVESAFDSASAWDSFERILLENYGYLDRPGVDGVEILARFRRRALNAQTDAEFIDTLQLLSHNFADPHFIVGPFDEDDWAIIPTSSDINGKIHDGRFIVREVRFGGSAQANGVRPGHEIVRINGKAPAVLIEEIMGIEVESLSLVQAEFALNIALAGKHRSERVLELTDLDHVQIVELAPTSEQAQSVANGPLLTTRRFGNLGVITIQNSLGNFATIREFKAAIESLHDTERLLIDLRNTPSGGNTVIAKAIMGHFVDHDMPYQMHVIPWEQRVRGTTRKFVEYVSPFGRRYQGKVYVAGGRWTGSMGEGMMLGFDAIGATTIGTDLGDLLGALSNWNVEGSSARLDLGTEQMFAITGERREDFRPEVYLEIAEASEDQDPILSILLRR